MEGIVEGAMEDSMEGIVECPVSPKHGNQGSTGRRLDLAHVVTVVT